MTKKKKEAPVKRTQKIDERKPIPAMIKNIGRDFKERYPKAKDFTKALNEFLQDKKYDNLTLQEAIQAFADATDHYVTEKDIVARRLKAFNPDWKVTNMTFKKGVYVIKIETPHGTGHIWVKVEKDVFSYGANGIKHGEI